MPVLLMLWALSHAPDYDAFSDRDGNITTERHGRGLIAMLQSPGQVEVIFADAEKGNARARRVFQTLETDYFPDSGRELAEQVSRPPCLVPMLRELSGWCVPDWSFLDFLSKDKPGGVRLRKAFFDGYAERARQRGLENQLVLSAMNALLGTAVAATAMREAGAAARTSGGPAVPSVAKATTPRLKGADRAVIDGRKLTEYALNPGRPVGGNKARVFERLGFNQSNAGDLMKQIRSGVAENEAIPGKVDEFGVRFTVDIPVTGPRGNGVVRTGWIIKPGSDAPELTTLFVK